MVAAPTVTAASTISDLTINWTAHPAGRQFFSYDLFLKPTANTAPISSCWVGYETTQTTTSQIVTNVPATCGGGTIRPGTSYQVAVRVIQQNPPKNVWSVISTASVTTPALPTHCQSTSEAFCTVFPNAFVKTASWPIADQGDPVVLNGANIKHGPYLNGTTWTTPGVVDQITNGFGSPGAPDDWNAIRLNLDWPVYQIKSGSSIIVDPAALTQLDTVIDAATEAGYYVILVPAHTRKPGALCATSPRMADATHDIPKWMWDLVSTSLPAPTCSSWSPGHQDFEDEVFARPEFRNYLRVLATRYSDTSTTAKAARSKTVVAIDMINEPRGSGLLPTRQANMLTNYRNLATDLRANPTATAKILMAEPVHGDTSLAQNGSDLATFAASTTNLVWSFHDYFGGGPGTTTPPTDPTFGFGRDSWGFPTGYDMTASVNQPYRSTNDEAQHRTYVEQSVGWATAQGLPVYIGEYGVKNPCWGNEAVYAEIYAEQTRNLYRSMPQSPGASRTVALSRTWWDDSQMELRRTSTDGGAGCGPAVGSFYSHAAKT